MSTPAWSALAARFSALAAEQEFQFLTYPRCSHGAFTDDEGRVRFAYEFGPAPGQVESYGVVIGSGSRQREEFGRINRFRWLAWAAGRLLRADPYTAAELHWCRHVVAGSNPPVCPGPAGEWMAFPDLVAASAEVARRFAAGGVTPPAPQPLDPTDNWPRILESLRVLRERFNSPRWHTARPDAALLGFSDPAGWEIWRKRDVEWPTTSQLPDHAPTGYIGSVWGLTEEVRAFVALAEDAGIALPIDLTYAPPLFPTNNPFSDLRPSGVWAWLELLYLLCPTHFVVQKDWPGKGCRIARLKSSPFTVSVIAIDRLLAAPSSEALSLFHEATAEYNPWLDGEDHAAVVAAIKAARRAGAVAPDMSPRPVTDIRSAVDAPPLTPLPRSAHRLRSGNPYRTLKQVLHELFVLAARCRVGEEVFAEINPTTDPWEEAEARARAESPDRGIPFSSFDPVLIESRKVMRELVQVAAGNESVAFSAMDSRYAHVEERLAQLGHTFSPSDRAAELRAFADQTEVLSFVMSAVVNGTAKLGAVHLATHVARRWAEARALGAMVGEYPPDEPHVETMPAFRNALLGLCRWARECAGRLGKPAAPPAPITPQKVEAASANDLPGARRTALDFIRQRIEKNSMTFRTIEFTDALRAAGGERHEVALLLEFERDGVAIPLPSVRSDATRPGGDFKELIVSSGPTEWRIGPGALAALAASRSHDGGKGDEPTANRPTVPAPPPPTAAKLSDPWVSYCGGALLCSSDFGTVRRGGDEFRLTPSQKACIRFMVEGWKHGHREFTNTELLDAIGSSADSIRDVFRSNGKSVPAWNALIVEVEGKKGKYTLRVSEKPLN